ncbi:MAG TPA: hypothetical protein VGE40_08825 [Bacilli bacterium]
MDTVLNHHVDSQYLNKNFRKNMEQSVLHFTGISLSEDTIDQILKICKINNRENGRYSYLLHTLWLIGDSYVLEAYKKAHLEGYMRSSVKILELMQRRMEYNDFEFNIFLEFKNLELNFNQYLNPIRRIAPIDKEIMKFIFQFIIRFKKENGIPIKVW